MNEQENTPIEESYTYRWTYDGQLAHDREQKKRQSRRSAWVYATVMAVAFAACLLLLGGTVWLSRKEAPTEALTVQEVSEMVNPGTVLIYASSNTKSGFGTGFFVRQNGYIVTNYHIIESMENVSVTLYSGEELEAEVVWYSTADDLAILKVDGKGYPTLKIGDSDGVKIGDTAIAVGNPGGNICPWTTTRGIISALDREVTVEGSRAIVDLTMMQTDAQVNPGNSGGPLCNDRGEVIGIVTRKLTDYEGIGMAIPINGAMELVNAFLDTGSAANVVSSVSKVRPTIGIQAAAVKQGDQITDSYVAPANGILVISVVSGGSADGTLLSGDLILEINGKTVQELEDLKEILYATRIGDTLQMKVSRFGQMLDLSVTLGS